MPNRDSTVSMRFSRKTRHAIAPLEPELGKPSGNLPGASQSSPYERVTSRYVIADASLAERAPVSRRWCKLVLIRRHGA